VDLHPAHRPAAELGSQPPDQLRGEHGTWVAQAVEPAVTASSPSAKLSGLVCAARSGADDLGPAAEHRADRGSLPPAVLAGGQPALDRVQASLRLGRRCALRGG
jgi:hypothetical protein